MSNATSRDVDRVAETWGSGSYQMCSRTVMDTTDPNIQFDADGVCNYWHDFRAFLDSLPSVEQRQNELDQIVSKVKEKGRGKKYDCVVGLSGGIDSSFVALSAKRLGLRPLAVHFDNGWNSELAVKNIENIVTKLKFDLHTFVMAWDQFRDLQRSYFKASVIDLEVPTDHMIFGALHKIARQHRIPFILSGGNYATEFILPKAWRFSKLDLANIKAIHRKFGTIRLSKLPALGVWQSMYYQQVGRIEDVPLLNKMEYDKDKAIEELKSEVGWEYYGGKHHESVFTRFYQGYILPRKFNVDKRKAHLSTLICTGKMTRDAALAELEQPPYPVAKQEEDKIYVAKKLGFSENEFEEILSLPNRTHEEFGTDAKQREFYFRAVACARPFTRTLRALMQLVSRAK